MHGILLQAEHFHLTECSVTLSAHLLCVFDHFSACLGGTAVVGW